MDLNNWTVSKFKEPSSNLGVSIAGGAVEDCQGRTIVCACVFPCEKDCI